MASDGDADAPTEETRAASPGARSADSSLGSFENLLRAVAHVPDAPPTPAQGDRLGRYVILGRLGAGGTGIVLSAYDPTLDRKVAIKLLRHDRAASWSANARERIEREARALARLGHPNIVAVYDVGAHDDNLYIVMELVGGENLRAWMTAPGRTTDAIVAAFVQAGAGLVAAHEAGLVHRDFKPDNVLIGSDGRIRVADFGLVRREAPATGERELDDSTRTAVTVPGGSAPPVAPDPDVGNAETVIPASTLTGEGAFLGTPGYMAPEQLRTAEVDARADQFGFCVAMWEALYGVRPFRAADTEPRLAQIAAGPRPPEAPPRPVPGWLRAALTRGLAADPAARYPSLRALVGEIDRRRRPRGRALAIGAVAVVAAAGLAVWIARPDAPAVCGAAPGELARVWNPARADAIARGFAARGAAGPGLGASVRAGLAAWGKGWVAQHTAACRATRVDGSQSPAMLDQRMACLRRLSGELDAVVTTLARGDARALEHASELVDQLSPAAVCGDLDQLGRAVPYPSQPGARAEIVAVEDAIAAVTSARYDRQRVDLEREADAAVARARATGWAPVLARALQTRGQLCILTADHACVVQMYREGLTTAFSASLDVDAIEFAAKLAVEAAVSDRGPAAEAWLDILAAMAARFPDRPYIRQLVASNRAQTYSVLGRPAEALAAAREAMALIDQDPDASTTSRAESRDVLATALTGAGEYDQAIALFEQAVALYDGVVKDGPNTALELANLSAALTGKGDLVAGCAAAERSLAISERWYGPDHAALANAVNNLASCLTYSGDAQAAIALHQRSLGMTEREHGTDSTDYGIALANLASDHAGLEQFDQAIAVGERALALLERRLGHDSVRLVIIHEILGYSYRHVGRLDDAERMLRRAVAINDATFPGGNASTANSRNELALVVLARGDLAGATTLFETSVAIADARPDVSPIVSAECRLQLAKLLRRRGGDRARIRALATRARDDYRGLGAGYAAQADEAAALAGR